MFSDKNFIDSKKLLAAKIILTATLFAFFMPLLVLPFFNHACTDDYFCGAHLNQLGFTAYQQYVYTECGGRFAATYVGALFAQNNFLFTHYYLHSLLLLLFNALSIVFLFSVINRFILKDTAIKKQLLLLSFIYLALTICSYPEPSTFLFWFSSAITYHLPIILFQVDLALFILLLNANSKTVKIICSILIPLLVFLIDGFNELFIVVHLSMLAAFFYMDFQKKISKAFTIIILVSFITSALIVLLAPGNHVRGERIESKGIVLGVAAVGYHAAETLWFICRNPFFWLVAIVFFIYGNNAKTNIVSNNWFTKITKRKWLVPFAITGFLLGSVALAVIGLKGGIIPDRYLNGVTYFTIMLLLAYAFIIGAITKLNISSSIFYITKNRMLLYSLFIIVLLGNSYIIDAYKSLISAPLYSNIIGEREAELREASASKLPVFVKDYSVSLREHLEKDYSHSTKTLYNLVQQKPSLLFFEDDLATDNSIDILRQYYQLDSIVVKRK